jgi:hypothetical protein
MVVICEYGFFSVLCYLSVELGFGLLLLWGIRQALGTLRCLLVITQCTPKKSLGSLACVQGGEEDCVERAVLEILMTSLLPVFPFSVYL